MPFFPLKFNKNISKYIIQKKFIISIKMKKLSLNFYGEEVSIQCPKNFVSLKKEIAEKYQLSLSDILEIDITYEKNESKKIIKSEIDFKSFLHSRVPNITLNINESSTLFKKSLVDLQNKAKDDLAQLETLKKKKEENKKKQEKEYQESKKKIDDLNKEIKVIGQKKLEYVKAIKKRMRGPRNKEKELMVKITKLGKEIGAPLVFQTPEKGPLPVKGETEKEKKFLELIQRNTECINVQEELYATPKKNMADMDKQIKEINKQCLSIIKNSQKEILSLKKEENDLVKGIIALEKKLGLSIDEKKPMKKFGFYIPNRDERQIKTIKKEDEKEAIKLKTPSLKLDIKLPVPPQKVNKKIENLVGNLRKNIKQDIEKHIIKTNNEIKKIKEKASENNSKLKEEDEKYLEKCQKENDNAIKEVDKWIEFIFAHSHEIIKTIEEKNKENLKKIDGIGKKIGINPLNESLSSSNFENKKIHPGVICDGCNGAIIGTRYKCTICKDFDYCEKCEEKSNGSHGHPLLKINNPDMCPVSIQCVLNNK